MIGVLVVDDDFMVARIHARFVEQTDGFEVVGTAVAMGGADLELQLSGDYVGKRYATYTNDLGIPGYFLLGLSVSGKVPGFGGQSTGFLKNLRWTISGTNLLNREGPLQPVVGQPSGSYATYPIPPRMGFITLKADI